MRAGCMAALVALVVAGCNAGRGGTCRIDSDCVKGLFCFQYTGTCEDRCTDSSDCPVGRLCMCGTSRECPAVDETTPVEDVEGGACLLPAEDAGVDADAPIDTVFDTATDSGECDPNADTDAWVPPDAAGLDCVSDEAPDALPDGGCVVPSSLPEPTVRLTTFAIGTDGNPGSGLNLDGNPCTCSPQPDPGVPEAVCSGGIDNAYWGLSILANDYMQDDVDAGLLNILIEMPGYSEGGCPFALDFFRGTRIPADPPVCPAGTACDYSISADEFDPECAAVSRIGNAVLVGDHLHAGPSPDVYYLLLVVVGLDIVLPMHEVVFDGTIVPGTDGPDTVDGIIAGYITETEFFGVFEAIPEAEYPVPGKDEVIDMLHELFTRGIIVNDADLDGDTILESGTIGLAVSGVPAHVTSVE